MSKPTMKIAEILSKKIQVLSTEHQKQILNFAESVIKQSEKTEDKQSTRISGLYQGQGWISDDFNDPLTDEFFSEI